jgi:hypothetical protein
LTQLADVMDHDLKPIARRMVSAAVRQPPARPQLIACLRLGEALQLKEGLELALALARGGDPGLRAQSAFLVGQLGTARQVLDLEPLLADASSVGAGTVAKKTVVATQVRDVALAAAVRLSGENLADYGFPVAQGPPGPQLWEQEYYLFGFADDASRDAALRKWKDGAAKRRGG